MVAVQYLAARPIGVHTNRKDKQARIAQNALDNTASTPRIERRRIKEATKCGIRCVEHTPSVMAICSTELHDGSD